MANSHWADVTTLGPMLAGLGKHVATIKTSKGNVALHHRGEPFWDFHMKIGERWFSLNLITSVARLADEVED